MKRTGFAAGLIGGLVGGALIASIMLVVFGGLAGDPEREALEARIDDRLGALEREMAALPELGERVEALEVREVPQAEIEAAEAQLRELESALQELREAGAAGVIDLGGITDRLATLEAEAADVRERLETPAEPDLEPLTAGLAELTEELAETRAEIQRTAEVAQREMAAVREQVDALAEPARQVPDLANRMLSLAEQVEQLQAGVAEATQLAAATQERLEADDRRIRHALALSLASARAQEALRRAEPFPGVVEVLAPVAEADPEVAAATETLRTVAAQGVPTLAELRETFPADEIVRRADGVDEDDLLGRAAENVLGLVTVRRHDERAEGVEAVVARAETRLAEGNLAAAIEEVETLSGEPAEAAAPWLERARWRLAAEAAVTRLQARADELMGAAL